MGKTKGPYKAEFPVGSAVRIADRVCLEGFLRSWAYHNKLDPQQLGYADRIAEIEDVGFYHGADELYRLKGIAGIWHEQCLLSAEPKLQGQPVRVDPLAGSTNPNLPAFIAAPKGAPAYYGFPLLSNSEKEGFSFGVITEPNGNVPASWGDAFVVAPDGSRAGIVWQAQGEPEPVVCEPSPGRWGVYAFRFSHPVRSEQDLIENLHEVLPQLKAFYAAALREHPESTNGGL